MTPTDKVEFNIEVSETDVAEEDVDNMTRQLLAELQELDVESAELAGRGAAPKVAEVVQDWSTRRQGCTMKFKGKGIEFEGSPEELRNLLAMLEKDRNKK